MNYKKPAEHSKFKSGQSGNPNGRPKRIDREVAVISAKLFKVVSKAKSGDKNFKMKLRKINKTLN